MQNKPLSWLVGLVFLGVIASNCQGQDAQSGRSSLPLIDNIEAFDTPNDEGGSITLTWARPRSIPEGSVYKAYIAESREGPYYPASDIAGGQTCNLKSPKRLATVTQRGTHISFT